ncbi:MAG: hypothetical protein HXY24_14975 [Rubrivivax sp.]|nr:hypothetical protein [Rubrivivax sp.]
MALLVIDQRCEPSKPGSRMMESNSGNRDGGAMRESFGPEFAVPVLAILLGVYYLLSTGDLNWESKTTGLVIGTTLMVMCGVQIVRLAVRMVSRGGSLGFGLLIANTLHNRRRITLVALQVLFIATIPWLGTTIGIFLLLLGSLFAMGVRSIGKLLGVSLTTAIIVYAVFMVLLNSRLPRGILENALHSIIAG